MAIKRVVFVHEVADEVGEAARMYIIAQSDAH